MQRRCLNADISKYAPFRLIFPLAGLGKQAYVVEGCVLVPEPIADLACLHDSILSVQRPAKVLRQYGTRVIFDAKATVLVRVMRPHQNAVKFTAEAQHAGLVPPSQFGGKEYSQRGHIRIFGIVVGPLRDAGNGFEKFLDLPVDAFGPELVACGRGPESQPEFVECAVEALDASLPQELAKKLFKLFNSQIGMDDRLAVQRVVKRRRIGKVDLIQTEQAQRPLAKAAVFV